MTTEGEPKKGLAMLLESLLEKYLSTNLRIRSPETSRLMRLSVKHFGVFLDRPPDLSDLTDDTIAAYVQHRRGLGKAEATVEREAAKISTLWNYAARRGLVLWPTISLPRAKREIPTAFSRQEIRALFRAAVRYDRPVGAVPGNVYMPALLAITFDTAERIRAVWNLETPDIDPRRRWVVYRSRKGSHEDIARRFRRSTAYYVGRLLRISTAARPFAPVHRSTLYYHLDRLLEAAGLPRDRRHKFHCLRRSHASHLHAAGGDATGSLAHGSEYITRVFYLDPRITGTGDFAWRLFDPLSWWGQMLAWFGM